jgi:hypothetical protein
MDEIQTYETQVKIMDLKSVGYFREMSDGSPNDPSIKNFIDKKAELPHKKEICAYLDGGIPIIVSPGLAYDVIDPSKGAAGSPTILTDGKWAWSGTLSYYVRNYNLALDSDFLKSMAVNRWEVPIKENDLDYSSLSIDGVSI